MTHTPTHPRGNGFTLIELIATTVLLGIISVAGGMFITEGARGYLLTRENTETSQKLDLAIMRLERELREVMAVSNMDSPTSDHIVFERPGNSNGRAIALVGNQIKVIDGRTLPTASTGHVLIDDVSGFTLTPFSGTNAWRTSDDIELLSAIRINLAYQHESAGTLTVSTTVLPRNNNNLGGSPPPDEVPEVPDYCFVATAACGGDTHPMVIALRNFRDRFLLTWDGGRAFVDFYYTNGPAWADYIRVRPWARDAAYVALLPLTGLALLLLWSPWAAAGVVLGTPLAVRAVRRACRPRDRDRNMFDHARGSVMLAVIGAMVFMGIVGAAMVPMFTTSITDQTVMNRGSRAFYLAEAGYAVAAHEYLTADGTNKDTKLLELHGKTYTLADGDGSFTIRMRPRWFEVTGNNNTQLTTVVLGELDNNFPPDSGQLLVNGVPFNYNGVTRSTTSYEGYTVPRLVFSLTTSAAGYDFTGFEALPRATAASDTFSRTNDLVLQSGADAFPEFSGAFTISSDSNTYTYQRRVGSTLTGIRLADSPTTDFPAVSVTSGDVVALDKFVTIRTTGQLGDASHTLTYLTPIGWTQAGDDMERASLHERFDNINANFATGGHDRGQIGSHTIANVDGGNALDVTGSENISLFGNTGYWSNISFSPGAGSPVNLSSIWRTNGNTLSYDAQLKLYVGPGSLDDNRYWVGGITFRMQNNSSGSELFTYGLSYLRARQVKRVGEWYSSTFLDGDVDEVPNAIVPSQLFTGTMERWDQGFWWPEHRYSQPAIVLWARDATSPDAGFKWLAYKILDASDSVLSGSYPNFRMKPWSTLMLRLVEAQPMNFTAPASTPIMSGAVINIGGDTPGSARLAGQPILTRRTWGGGGNVQGTLPLAKIKGNIRSTGGVLFENPDGSQGTLTLTGTLGAKTNYIRAFYGDTTAHGTTGTAWNDNNRHANPRNEVHWPPDDRQSLTTNNDCMTLVQWDNVSGGATNVTTSVAEEQNSIVTISTLLSPDSGMALQSTDLGIHAVGNTATNLYFDDFGFQAWTGRGGKGFRAPIMYSN
ncbi:prepilin-type N-terminal cleavage/methylation domain-containing protein [Desulfobaculum xiamenense]|uniref:Prepilin-type N-terminal cleavage/methylation domain-containing protein n=1 Tax=Desulfobaculum xiamenense TaxID=995050 RepID=A0A846QTR9_9BACT|nr:prepilin-type N-terminal cleavage/methylation domain-containing protein [Desulfobaculum xiamenense]NJB68564.1 prepilin-type N-terminal cleavage/methylation domain-containing protein [Desulfobaculum xiamenense]